MKMKLFRGILALPFIILGGIIILIAEYISGDKIDV